MEKYFGFTVERKTSTIYNGGIGVYITKGRVKQGSLVALYPGEFLSNKQEINPDI